MSADVGEREGLPEGWIETTLGDCCEVLGGKRLPKGSSLLDYDTGFPYIRVTDFLDYTIDTSRIKYLSKDVQKNISRYIINSSDVYISIAGTIGRVGIVPEQLSGSNLTENAARIIPSSSTKSRYLMYHLSSQLNQDQIKEKSIATTQDKLGLFRIKELNIFLPPVAEQIRIADKLDALLSRVEAGRERLERVPKLVKRFRQSVLSAAVSGELTREWRGGGDAEWEEVTTGQLFSDKPRNGYSPQAVDFQTSVRSLTLGATTTGRFNPSKFKYIDENISSLSHLWLEEGDILIQRANSLEYVGVSAIFHGESNTFIYPDLMMKAKASEATVREFVHYTLLSEPVRQYFRDNATGTAGNMPKINQKTVMDAPALLPPLHEQQEIVRRVEALFALADRLEARFATAQAAFTRLTPALLAKAFRGELVEQDPSDEPASVLLERVRAQRAEAGAEPKRGRKPGATGKMPKQASQGGAAGETSAPKRRGRPPKVTPEVAMVPSSYEDVVRQLEQRKLESATGTRQAGLFSVEE